MACLAGSGAGVEFGVSGAGGLAVSFAKVCLQESREYGANEEAGKTDSSRVGCGRWAG